MKKKGRIGNLIEKKEDMMQLGILNSPEFAQIITKLGIRYRVSELSYSHNSITLAK